MGASSCCQDLTSCWFTILSHCYGFGYGLRGLGFYMLRGAPEPNAVNSKPTTEFAQPRLSRVKARSSPARGYKFGCVCSYMAGHYPGILMTGHIGANTSKFVPVHWGPPRFDTTQTGLCKFSRGFGQLRPRARDRQSIIGKGP